MPPTCPIQGMGGWVRITSFVAVPTKKQLGYILQKLQQNKRR